MRDLTSIVVFKFNVCSNINTFFIIWILLSKVFTMWIVFSTDVAELMATSASHVVAPFILLHPVLAS